MLTSRYNPETEQLWREFQQLSKRVEELETPDAQSRAARAWGQAVGGLLSMPQWIGFWPMSNTNRLTTSVYDLGGNNLTLTNNNSATFGVSGVVPYTNFITASSQYLSRVSEDAFKITGSMWQQGWFYFTSDSMGNAAGLMGKWGPGTNRSYLLNKTAGDLIQATVTVDGTALTQITSAAITVNTWYCVTMVFVANTRLTLFVNGVETENTTSIPATVFDSTYAFEIGRLGTINYFGGRAALCQLGVGALGDTVAKNAFHQTRWAFGV